MSNRRAAIFGAAVCSFSALVAFSAPASAQNQPPRADCMKTETQAECHARLKCLPDEELEDCKKRRARAIKEGRDPDKEPRRKEDADRDREDADKKDADKKDADKKDADKKDQDRDRDDDDKKPRERRDRDRDRDDDDKKPRERRDRDRNRDRDDNEGGQAAAARARDRDDDDDDNDRGGGGGGGRSVLRPGTRPGFFSGGVGPSFAFCYRGNCDPGDYDYAAFYGTLDFGWHFSGDFEGPAIGANIHAGYGSIGPFNHGRLGAGFKFWWDIQIANKGFYIAPVAQVGWSSFTFESRRICDPRFFECGNDWEHFFNFQLGMQLRFVLGNRGLVYVQPVTFDNVVNGGGYGLLYHFEVGGGVIFGD